MSTEPKDFKEATEEEQLYVMNIVFLKNLIKVIQAGKLASYAFGHTEEQEERYVLACYDSWIKELQKQREETLKLFQKKGFQL